MNDCALHDRLEARRRFGCLTVRERAFIQSRYGPRNGALQLTEIDSAGAHHRCRVRVIGQCQRRCSSVANWWRRSCAIAIARRSDSSDLAKRRRGGDGSPSSRMLAMQISMHSSQSWLVPQSGQWRVGVPSLVSALPIPGCLRSAADCSPASAARRDIGLSARISNREGGEFLASRRKWLYCLVEASVDPTAIARIQKTRPRRRVLAGRGGRR